MALSIEGSLACHTYCDTGHLFMMDGRPMTLTPYAERFGSGAVTTCFNDLGLSQLGFEHPTLHLQGERSDPLRHHRSALVLLKR